MNWGSGDTDTQSTVIHMGWLKMVVTDQGEWDDGGGTTGESGQTPVQFSGEMDRTWEGMDMG